MTVILDGLESWMTHPVMEQVGWVLVHFVWQGAFLAGILAGVLFLLRAERARLRYAISLIVLAALALCPIVTWTVLPTPESAISAAEASWRTLAEPAVPHLIVAAPAEPATSWTAVAQSLLAASLPWIVAAWLVGVVVLALRLLGGWAVTVRLRAARSTPVRAQWQRRAGDLAERLGITWPVRVRRSSHIDVPMVVGWLRPVVLMPAGVLTGLPPQQVEALLAHELCHIRRHDVLVGWLQALVETLLFYHPAVWWISQQVRIEREHCCDDLAVAVCRDRVTYAQALTTLAGRQQVVPAGSVGAAGGSLLARIRRLVHASSVEVDANYRPPLLIVGVLLVAGALGVAACASQRPASNEPDATPAVTTTTASPDEPTAPPDEEPPRESAPESHETVDVYVAETESEEDGENVRRRQVVVDSSGHITVWSDSAGQVFRGTFDALDSLKEIAPNVWLGMHRFPRGRWHAFGDADTIPKPPRPVWPRVAPFDSMAFVFPDPPDIDVEAFRALDSLRTWRMPSPPVPPTFFMDGDTIEVDELRSRMDSLRVVWPRELDSLERARVDSLRRRVERQMRVHREQMHRFDEEHRERIERLHRELRDRMQREQPERLREQAEALRRQAERLEEQARAVEQQRPAPPDTAGSSGLRGALPFDAGPFGTLRAGARLNNQDRLPAGRLFSESVYTLAVVAARSEERTVEAIRDRVHDTYWEAPAAWDVRPSVVRTDRASVVRDIVVPISSGG